MLFSYPFSSNHLLNKIAVETKAELEYSPMVGKYFLGAYLASGWGNDGYGFFSIINKVEHVFWRLKKRALYLKKKGNH